jgi:hypothetical protein
MTVQIFITAPMGVQARRGSSKTRRVFDVDFFDTRAVPMQGLPTYLVP